MIRINTENRNNIFLTLSCYNVNTVTSSFYIKNKNLGTGNILFQIASLLHYAYKHNAKLFVPCLNTYFQLENLKKENTIYRYIYTDIPENYNDNMLDFCSISDYYIFNQPFYNNMHIRGYFENFNNFDENRNLILNYFRPNEEDKKYILEKYPIIRNDNISSIHIRMGPDIKNYYSIDHINMIENTYQELINHMIEHKNVEIFMVFTNDKSYCETFLNNSNDKYKNIQFIYSEEEIDFFDIWIISMIKNNIISFSTFSLWGSYLNENQDKYIVGSNKTVKEKLKYHEWIYI